MADRSGLQTPYSDAVAPTPSGAADGQGTSGGFDFPDGRSETPNSSGLPLLPTTVNPGQGAPGVGASIGMPPVDSPGTIPTSKPGA